MSIGYRVQGCVPVLLSPRSPCVLPPVSVCGALIVRF